MHNEMNKIVPLVLSVDYDIGFTSAAVNMAGVHHATIAILFGTVADGGLLHIESADQAEAGGNATSLVLTGKRSNEDIGDAGSDRLTHDVEVTPDNDYYTINDDPFSDKLVVFEVPVTKMVEGRPWLRLRMTNNAANGVITALAICKTRYGPEDTLLDS